MIYLGIVFVCMLLFACIYGVSKNKKPFRRAFLSMLFGVISLAVVNIIGIYCNVSIPISPFSLTVSACGGVPAVAAMLLIDTLL